MENAYFEFLASVIKRGMDEVLDFYSLGSTKQLGCWEGFAACRGKTPEELLVLYSQCEVDQFQRLVPLKVTSEIEEMHRLRFAKTQIEWVLNVITARSIILKERTFKPLGWHPTARAMLLAAELLGRHFPSESTKLPRD